MRFAAPYRRAYSSVVERQKGNPFGVPYRPVIWGAGWDIQHFGVEQYFLHRAFADIVSPQYMLNALNFVLGVHPGENTASFASGVGSRSMTTAYGINRADWSYIPGGVASGTALIRPDFPELKDFPYLWQQGEYVLGGGSSNYMFLVLAADQVRESSQWVLLSDSSSYGPMRSGPSGDSDCPKTRSRLCRPMCGGGSAPPEVLL